MDKSLSELWWVECKNYFIPNGNSTKVEDWE